MSRPRIHPAAGGLIRALRADGGALVVERADAAPWRPVTFDGTRHLIALRFMDADAALRLAEGLAGREFAIPGHLVADIGEVEAEGAILRFAALTIVDA